MYHTVKLLKDTLCSLCCNYAELRSMDQKLQQLIIISTWSLSPAGPALYKCNNDLYSRAFVLIVHIRVTVMVSLRSTCYLWRARSSIRYKCFAVSYYPSVCPNQGSLSFSTLSGNAAASDDRHLLVQKSREKLHQLLNSPTRYQSIDDREDRSDVPQKLIHCESVG